MSDWPQKFLQAFKQRHHYDSMSEAVGGLSIDDAYDVQHRYVELRNETISGYKAALTAPAAQQAMGIDQPIIGVLFAAGEQNAASPVVPAKALLLETELGFIAAQDITMPVQEAEVLALVSDCLPLIELASPNLATQPNAIDLVATNAASHGYLAGHAAPARSIDLDQIEVTLRNDHEVLWQARSSDVLGGQRQALAFLINEVLARGYSIRAGHLLMTGSIGGMAPAKPGGYRAEFGTLGTIEFSVQG